MFAEVCHCLLYFVLVASSLHELCRIWLGHVLSNQETTASPEEGELSTEKGLFKRWWIDHEVFNYLLSKVIINFLSTGLQFTSHVYLNCHMLYTLRRWKVILLCNCMHNICFCIITQYTSCFFGFAHCINDWNSTKNDRSGWYDYNFWNASYKYHSLFRNRNCIFHTFGVTRSHQQNDNKKRIKILLTKLVNNFML